MMQAGEPGSDPRLLINIFRRRDVITDEMREQMEAEISERIDTIVWQYFHNAKTTPEGLEGIAKIVTNTDYFNRWVREIINRNIAANIGNELRVGSNGWELDKLFKAAWTAQLENAINDRIRRKVYDAVDTFVGERLDAIKTAVDKVRPQ